MEKTSDGHLMPKEPSKEHHHTSMKEAVHDTTDRIGKKNARRKNHLKNSSDSNSNSTGISISSGEGNHVLDVNELLAKSRSHGKEGQGNSKFNETSHSKKGRLAQKSRHSIVKSPSEVTFVDMNEAMRQLTLFEESDEELYNSPKKFLSRTNTLDSVSFKSLRRSTSTLRSRDESESISTTTSIKLISSRGLKKKKFSQNQPLKTTKNLPYGSRSSILDRLDLVDTADILDDSVKGLNIQNSKSSKSSEKSLKSKVRAQKLSTSSYEAQEEETYFNNSRDEISYREKLNHFLFETKNSKELLNDHVSEAHFRRTMLRIQKLNKIDQETLLDSLSSIETHRRRSFDMDSKIKGRRSSRIHLKLSEKSNLISRKETEVTKTPTGKPLKSPSSGSTSPGKLQRTPPTKGKKKLDKKREIQRKEAIRYNVIELNRIMNEFIDNSDITIHLLPRMSPERRRYARILAKTYGLKTRTLGGGGKRSDLNLIKTKHSSIPCNHDLKLVMDRLMVHERQLSLMLNLDQLSSPNSGIQRSSPKVVSRQLVGGDAAPLHESNIGNVMLRRLGWSPGSGLGLNSGGIRVPIQAIIRRERRGLGS